MEILQDSVYKVLCVVCLVFFFYREVDLEVKSKIINPIISSLKWQDFF